MEKTKNILFGSLARERLLEGMRIAHEAILHSYGTNVVANGDKIISSIEVEDPLLECGISFIRKATHHMNQTCSNGSVLAALLLYKLTEESFKYISLNHNPIILKNGLEKATSLLLSHLKNKTQKLTNKKDLYDFAKSCINEDDAFLEIIIEAFDKSGEEQIILVKEDPSSKPHLEFVRGFYIKSGLVSPYFISNKNDMSLEIKDVKVLVSEKTLTSSLEILEEIAHHPLLIMAPDIEGEALSSLIANKIEQKITVCPIKIPKNMLEEIKHLKKAQKVYADSDSTVIFEGEKNLISIIHTNHSKKLLNKQIANLKSALKDGILSNCESILSTTQKELDRSQFSPAEKPVLTILEKAFSWPLELLLLNNSKESTNSFHVISEAITTALSITSTLLLSEALIMETPK